MSQNPGKTQVVVLKKHGYSVTRQQYIDAIEQSLDVLRCKRALEIETPYVAIIKDGLARLGIESRVDLVRLIEDSDYLHYHWRLRPGVRDAMAALSKKRQLGVVSNSWSDSVLRVLGKSRLLRYFKTIVLSKDVGYRKPNPRIFIRAIEDLDLRPNQVCFVGDNYHDDVIGPASVGITPIWLDGTELRGLAKVPRELFRILPRISSDGNRPSLR